jgi:hypothetical protein
MVPADRPKDRLSSGFSKITGVRRFHNFGDDGRGKGFGDKRDSPQIGRQPREIARMPTEEDERALLESLRKLSRKRQAIHARHQHFNHDHYWLLRPLKQQFKSLGGTLSPDHFQSGLLQHTLNDIPNERIIVDNEDPIPGRRDFGIIWVGWAHGTSGWKQ